jgi:hypothetical protein
MKGPAERETDEQRRDREFREKVAAGYKFGEGKPRTSPNKGHR